MPEVDILLVTLNARYQHCAFGLRYLYANLGDFQSRARIAEFTISESAKDIAEKILSQKPKLVGFGVYIWNTDPTYEVVSILKKVAPEIIIVLGGPEVSYETETQPICKTADYVVRGEADFLFRELCHSIFVRGIRPDRTWVSGEIPEIKLIESPYRFYTDDDIKNRVLYVEASRGCPYKCEYCLSSLDKSVRSFDLDRFLSDMQMLMDRGARQFKFVDRTFNLSIATGTKILQFFLDRMDLGLFLHFELVPDRLPKELRDLIVQFPAGSLQFEIGIQTWNPEVSRLISRRQDCEKIRENFEFLSTKTGVHTHADLIVGLPAETLESFAAGFDILAGLCPDEIQVGILKRLKGTPISRHDQEWQMVYQEHPPFQILKTKTMSFQIIQEMTRFSKYWDLVANSGNFIRTLELFREVAKSRADSSLFWMFYEFSGFLTKRHPQTHGIALLNLLESVWIYLTEEMRVSKAQAREILTADYAGTVSRDLPRFLRDEQMTRAPRVPQRPNQKPQKVLNLPERQQRRAGVTLN
jgi:radical SAM superfamily enzyme YgiQ (UPF0313 family)